MLHGSARAGSSGAAGGAAGVVLIPSFEQNANVYLCSPLWGAASILTLFPNTIYLTPVWVPRQRLYTTIAVNVTTLAAGALRLGIWDAAPDDGLAQTLLVEPTSTTQIDTGTTGVKTATFSRTLNPGLYWLGLNANAAPLLTGVGASNPCGVSMTAGAVAAYRGHSIPTPYGPLADVGTATPAGITTSAPLIGIR